MTEHLQALIQARTSAQQALHLAREAEKRAEAVLHMARGTREACEAAVIAAEALPVHA